MPKVIVAALLAITAFAAMSLASGAPYLEMSLPGGLPFGNILTAIGLCAAAGSAVGLSSRGTALRTASLAALAAAAAWLPVSIALAGNLSLNFAGGRGAAWLALSLAVIAWITITLCWAILVALLSRRKLPV